MSVSYVFLCKTPDTQWLSRLECLQGSEDIHVVVDDEELQVDPQRFPRLHIHTCKTSDVREGKYFGASFLLNSPQNVMAWEKALWLHRQGVLPQRGRMWLIEDDVLIPSSRTLQTIDANVSLTADLVTTLHLAQEDDPSWFWWSFTQDLSKGLTSERYHSIGCARRVSQRLLAHIHDYVDANESLAFHEILFNTLAHHARLEIQTADELSTIVWRREWDEFKDFDTEHLFHPVKDMEQQQRVWDRLSGAQHP